MISDGVEGGLERSGFFGPVPRELTGDQTVVVLLYEDVRAGSLPNDHLSGLKHGPPVNGEGNSSSFRSKELTFSGT